MFALLTNRGGGKWAAGCLRPSGLCGSCPSSRLTALSVASGCWSWTIGQLRRTNCLTWVWQAYPSICSP